MINLVHFLVATQISQRVSIQGRPRPIVCNFIQRITCKQVSVSRKEVTKVNATSIGLPENVSIEHASILDHFTSCLQALLPIAKKVQGKAKLSILLGQRLDSVAEEKQRILTHGNQEYEEFR